MSEADINPVTGESRLDALAGEMSSSSMAPAVYAIDDPLSSVGAFGLGRPEPSAEPEVLDAVVVLDAVATEGETTAPAPAPAAARKKAARRPSGDVRDERAPPKKRRPPAAAPAPAPALGALGGLDAVMKLAEAASSCLAGEDPGEEAAELLEEELADAEPPPPPPVNTAYRAKLPSLEAMRAAGYLESAQSMTKLWAWVKEHDPGDAVWPTPVATAEEALRFNACGWPDEKTTPEEWLAMLSYWTALREQMITGASRARRKQVTAAFEGFGR
jgi:hypothetical protein